jgi:hypothetical protein
LWDPTFQINVAIFFYVNKPLVKLMTRLGLEYFVTLFKNFLKFEVECAKKLDTDSVGSAGDE